MHNIAVLVVCSVFLLCRVQTVDIVAATIFIQLQQKN